MIPSNKFSDVAATEKNINWNKLIKREKPIDLKENDIRSDFGRDYTRILHCFAFRRLKHKTQVFFNTSNDHVCTRMEHVAHVESVSFTIANYLGLNTELTKAISMSHDLGHAPFGHHGENVLKTITKENLQSSFWHEHNGLRFVDKIELLEDNKRNLRNLNLTYAVRDGIISHCGEINQNNLSPRTNFIDLNDYTESNQYQPITWEACVVKIADNIAYIGRDIEDAFRLKFISREDTRELYKIAKKYYKNTSINTTAIMHSLIIDLCLYSSPEIGLGFSNKNHEMINEIKSFSLKAIYNNSKFESYKRYADLIITQIFNTLVNAYVAGNTIESLIKLKKIYPELITGFLEWLKNYIFINKEWGLKTYKTKNNKIYGSLSTKEIYIQAIIDYIAGMTDKYAVRIFQELVKF
jgi:dGTPase